MPTSYWTLKEYHSATREQLPAGLSLRVHRALSWLDRAERCEDDDGRFIFLWITFNAAYAHELGETPRFTQSEIFRNFLSRLVSMDGQDRLHDLVWEQYAGPIRILLNNKYVFQQYWDSQNGRPEAADWEVRFRRAQTRALQALAGRQTEHVLAIVFSRLYTLRNQLVHGGATWNSSANRNQLRDGTRILGGIVPYVIEIMMENAHAIWGEPCYPVTAD